MKFDERNQNKKNSPFLISMATAAKFVLPIPIFLAYLVPLDVDVTGNITAKLCEVWSEFNIFCTLVTMETATILIFFNPTKAATYYGGYSCKVSWSLMKGILIVFKSPLFCFHGNCDEVCPTDSDFFGLSRSTRCGCCSYQVSSISSRRIIIVKKKRRIAIHHPTTVSRGDVIRNGAKTISLPNVVWET